MNMYNQSKLMKENIFILKERKIEEKFKNNYILNSSLRCSKSLLRQY